MILIPYQIWMLAPSYQLSNMRMDMWHTFSHIAYTIESEDTNPCANRYLRSMHTRVCWPILQRLENRFTRYDLDTRLAILLCRPRTSTVDTSKLLNRQEKWANCSSELPTALQDVSSCRRGDLFVGHADFESCRVEVIHQSGRTGVVDGGGMIW